MKLTGVANAIRIAAAKLSTDVAVRAFSTDVSAQDERIAASIVASSTQAEIAAVRVNAAIVVSPIQLAYELGLWLTHFRYQDSFGALDRALLSFFKTKTESLSVAEDTSTQFYKTLKETLGLSDRRIFSIFKGIADLGKATDQYRMLFQRGVADSAKIRDLASLKPGKNPTDTARFVDSKAFLLTKLLLDSGSFSDALSRSLSRSLNEIPKALDTQSRSFTKALLDQLSVTDDFDGNASLLDDQKMSFIKQRTESAQFSDLKAIEIQRVRAESARVLDSGSLRSHNYCDFSYFAEDFVGTSLTF